MPRFFFDTRDGIERRDEEGIELNDEAAARAHATTIAAAYANDPKMLSSDGGAIIVEVLNEARIKLITVRLAFGVERQ